MIRTFVHRVLAALMLCMSFMSPSWALPRVDEVQAAVQRGDYASAESLMRQVVAAKPDSGRAHYVLAEILAHGRHFDEAKAEFGLAKTADPALKFADASKIKQFETLLDAALTEQARARHTAVSTPLATAQPVKPVVDVLLDVMPYVVGLAAVLMIVSFLLRAMRPAPQASPFSSGGGYYSAAQPSAGGGSGIGVGTAAAGGFVAGMVAEHFLHGRDQEKPHESGQPHQGGSNSTGWIDSSPSSAGDTLANRPIDFGSGDGWGGNDGGGSSSGDGGGSSSDDASW